MVISCRYLALVTALATEADYVFVPESPEDSAFWKDKMCEKCLQVSKSLLANSQ